MDVRIYMYYYIKIDTMNYRPFCVYVLEYKFYQ
jgi:hypothetical protein